jgi:hypothetical protein
VCAHDARHRPTNTGNDKRANVFCIEGGFRFTCAVSLFTKRTTSNLMRTSRMEFSRDLGRFAPLDRRATGIHTSGTAAKVEPSLMP